MADLEESSGNREVKTGSQTKVDEPIAPNDIVEKIYKVFHSMRFSFLDDS